MKHPITPAVSIIVLFLVAQVLGLITLSAYMQKDALGKTSFREVMIGDVELERPETSGSETVILIGVAVLLGTLLMFFLMWLNWPWIWKTWFTLAVTGCLTIALAGFIPSVQAFWIALALAIWRTLRPNIIIHNLTEIFLYGGLAVLFVPLLTISSASVLLILISIYDAYAVWKSQHMVTLAKFQTKAQIFAGMMVPYDGRMPKLEKKNLQAKVTTKQMKSVPKQMKAKVAILGGGDVGFPLIFAGTLLGDYGATTLVIPVCTTIALSYLMFFGKKDRFYPAMPYLSVGCFVGLGIIVALKNYAWL